jgi:hypothetical protein
MTGRPELVEGCLNIIDPFGGGNPRFLRWGKEAPLRVNPEQARAFRPASRRVDNITGVFDNQHISFPQHLRKYKNVKRPFE